ncbi:MAG: aldo/keto reductase [Lachnospiraceae bacterium]|nr:aldo/keto reductase [Lachnospiraceae bacterium]
MYKLNDAYIMSNGTAVPCIGFGTWQTPEGQTAEESVKTAIKYGYRHIDSAALYENEAGVGKGIAGSGISRKELFVTSKVWNTERGYKKTMAAFQRTLDNLGLDYLDLYLIHWPANKKQFADWEEINLGTWRAMTEIYKSGRAKAIGVSNFMPHHLEALMQTEIKPMVNQIEFHPGFMQQETVNYCKKNIILVEAYSPLGTGRMLNNKTLKEIAAKYDKSVAQLCIKWCLQHDIIPLPKSVTASRIEENSKVFDFEITDGDMEIINSMEDFGSSGKNPDEVDF